MAFLSKEEAIEHIKHIAELGGDSEEIMTALKTVQDDYEERFSTPPPEPPKWSDADVMDSSGKRYADQLAEANKRYRDRFFGGGDTPPPEDQPTAPETKTTFEDLFTPIDS